MSFTDSDLASVAQAYRGASGDAPSLCLTSMGPLKHPLSIDLYLEQVAAHAKVILVRLLGGQEWWPYGCEELGRLAREKNIALIMVPGCGHPDEVERQLLFFTAPIISHRTWNPLMHSCRR